MQKADTNLADFWLTIPQSVYLEATRDIETALRLPTDDPQELVVNVMRRVARVSVADQTNLRPLEAKETALSALISKRGRYNDILCGLKAKLVGGLTVKGRRGPDLPLELIDPAEFTGLEFSGVDAVARSTGDVVWHGLRVSARAQASLLASETLFECWDGAGDPLPTLLEWARQIGKGKTDELPSREELLRLHRKQFGRVRGISQTVMRVVRERLASEKSKKGGSPVHRH